MVTNISIANYKAFRNASIPIKPLTILIGANSVGKSSILQLFLLLQQTGRAGLSSYKSAIKLYGGYVNLGEPRNLFHKQNIETPLSLTFSLEDKSLYSSLSSGFLNSLIESFQHLPLYFPLKGLNTLKDGPPVRTKADFKSLLDAIVEVMGKSNPTTSAYKKEMYWFFRHRLELYMPPLDDSNKLDYVELFDFFSKLKKNINSNSFNIRYDFLLTAKNTLEVFRMTVSHPAGKIIDIDFDTMVFKSQFITVNANESDFILGQFNPASTIFNSFDNINIDKMPLKPAVLIQMAKLFQNALKKEFSDEKINYVSPLRAHPKRYYMLDKAKVHITLDTLDGDAVAEVLKDNKDLTKRVNTWLTKFGVEVNVKEFKQVIHHLVVKQNSIDLDITDVGFGISQILPVIIQGFLSSSDSTTIIEQPEIHLHPKMQADLADLFIDVFKTGKNKRLVIETHSEYFLKRLRRRIADGTIKADDVAICLFHPQNDTDSATIEVLDIANKGYFEWPKDFIDGELMKDTIEFLKYQD